MKKKLRKDLKFLDSVIGKLITALIIGGLGYPVGRSLSAWNTREFYGVVAWIIATAFVYIALYFFNAWLVGDEED